ncbi:GNAT family N-acetyltransferase [Streptomyces sp. NPDC085639]|uniref:GNAT family N-acetyltransferase n=1 Tax=Streptomyces sp. NPDC085639 TaxID=3365734 RepID=UPI0037D53C25
MSLGAPRQAPPGDPWRHSCGRWRPPAWDTWYETLERAFDEPPTSPQTRELWQDLTEPGRSIGAWDGDECLGAAGAFSLGLSVPAAPWSTPPG